MSNFFKLLQVSSVALVLTACGSLASLDEGVGAQLDYENARMVTPLDEYLATPHEQLQIFTAGTRIVEDCMRGHGAEFEDSEIDKFFLMNRDYGIWTQQMAETEWQLLNLPKADSGKITSGDSSFNDLRVQCINDKNADLKKYSDGTKEDSDILLETLRWQAREEAQKKPLWKKKQEERWACMEERGLTVPEDRNELSAQEAIDLYSKEEATAEDQAEIVRISKIEADCAQETDFVQTLADLEAKAQMPLIRQHEAELKEYKAKKDQWVAGAREYLATRS